MIIKNSLKAFILISLVLIASIAIMILPSFVTKGVSRIELNQELQLDLVLDEDNDIELVFFGYAGCSDICTPRLETISQWYTQLPLDLKNRLGLKFLDLSVPKDKKLPDSFAKAFHQDFKGVYLEPSLLRNYTKAFSVYFSPSLMNETEIDHTSHLYLAKRDKVNKKLRFIYTAYPYDFKQIQHDIQELLHEPIL